MLCSVEGEKAKVQYRIGDRNEVPYCSKSSWLLMKKYDEFKGNQWFFAVELSIYV